MFYETWSTQRSSLTDKTWCQKVSAIHELCLCCLKFLSQLFDTFTFDEDSHESADKIDDVIAKFESPCLPQRNETYERYLFNKRE